MIILSLLNGSRLYGLEHEKSDYDILTIYMKHRNDYYLNQPDIVSFRKRDSINYQITYVDILTLCRQLLKCNPHYLIAMLKPKPFYVNTMGFTLLENIDLFYDYEKVKVAFTGMARSIRENINKKTINTEAKAIFIENFRDMMLTDLMDEDTKAETSKIKNMLDIMFCSV